MIFTQNNCGAGHVTCSKTFLTRRTTPRNKLGLGFSRSTTCNHVSAAARVNPLQLSRPDTRGVASSVSLVTHTHSIPELGFGFTAGGWLFPYYIGLLRELQELNVINSQTRLAGASAGSLICAAHAAGLQPNEVLDACLRLARDCRRDGTALRLSNALQKLLDSFLPDDAHVRCSGKVFISVTQTFPTVQGNQVGHFSSKADLVQALVSSCHIPFWSDGTLHRTFRGALACDGAFSALMPSPPGVSRAVLATCLPVGSMLGTLGQPIAIGPDVFEPFLVLPPEWISWCFAPPSDAVILDLVWRGARDGRRWAAQQGLRTAARHAMPLPMPGAVLLP